MNGWITFAIGIGAALLVMVPAVAASLWWQVPPDHETMEPRVTAPRTGDRSWAVGCLRDTPDVAEAHMTMQRHRSCDITVCRRKQAAWQTLIDAGRIRPDASRQR
ncbi:hypothetical protein ABTW96_29040 [Nocardia beijingensis]|uniref:hypothetical protein n=1 Tax=Nocardia beijingensis TaxID=95162 RepID=UPI00331D9471